MNRILVIVEGAKDEKKLLEAIFNSYSLNGDFEIISIEHNISMIFDVINNPKNDYLSEPVDFKQVFSDILLSENRIDDYNLLQQKIPYTYLMFDLDPQHQTFCFDNVKKMLAFFNDETENGKLLINYPQFEAFRDYLAPAPDFSFKTRCHDYSSGKTYKQVVSKRGTWINYSKMSQELYSSIIVQNICKCFFLSNESFSMPSYPVFLQCLEGLAIIDKQQELYLNKKIISILCESIFVVPLYFGKDLYLKLLELA